MDEHRPDVDPGDVRAAAVSRAEPVSSGGTTRKGVRTNFVLVDYENVQPSDFSMLQGGAFKVKVFLGRNQSRIPVALATALQRLGTNAEYVLLQSSGSNALDFHIAYYIGRLSSEDSCAFFHVISKDSGFDPLLTHLRTKGILANRSASIAAMPCFKPAAPTRTDSQLQAVIIHLAKMKASKPRAQKTLRRTMHALFRKELSENQLTALFALLCKRGIVKVDGTKVSYDLPSVM